MGKRGNGAGSVRKRKDGRWEGLYVADWKDGKPVRRSVYAKTKDAAEMKLRKALSDLDAGLPAPDARTKLGPFLHDWLAGHRHGIKASTAEHYAQQIRLHIEPRIGRIVLSKLQPQDVARLHSDLLDTGLSNRTVEAVHRVLHLALEQAVRWNLVPRNVAGLVKAPRPNPKEPVFYDEQQVRTLLAAAASDRLRALYVLAIATGMRQGELLALRWADVQLDAGVVQVRRTLSRIAGQGWVFTEPKTAKGRRSIALPAFAVAALREHRIRQHEERLAAGPAWKANDLVFPTRRGTPIERQNLQRRSWKPLLKRAGLPDIKFHALRDTAATLMFDQGINPKIVQERLGHATIAVTMDIYSHVLPNMQADAAAKLDSLSLLEPPA
jgi:integrase